MLACIACSTKDGGDQDGPRAATPHGRDAGKSLTSQVNQTNPQPDPPRPPRCTLPDTWIMDATPPDTAAGGWPREQTRSGQVDLWLRRAALLSRAGGWPAAIFYATRTSTRRGLSALPDWLRRSSPSARRLSP